MFQFNDIIYDGHENMGLKHYKDGFKDLHGVWYDALKDSDVAGVLKANFYIDGKLRQVYSDKDSHSVVVAGTGLGKTTQVVIPTIKSYARQKTKKSMLISDPKGEVRKQVEGDLRANGYKILALDFRNPTLSECWNPLTPLYRKYHRALDIRDEVELVQTPDGPRNKFLGKIYNSQAKLMRDVLTVNKLLMEEVGNDIDDIAEIIAPPTGSADDKMWEDGARDIIKALLWGMLEDSNERTRISREPITEDNFSFATMLSISNNFMGERDTSYYDYDKGYFSRRRADSKALYYASNVVIGPSSQTRASFMSVYNTQVNSFKNSAINLITRCNSFDFSELMQGPTAVFINYRDEVKTSYSIISLFVQKLYIYLIEEANKQESGALKTPWYFILDEFGNFPRMRDFDSVISACRSRNIYFMLIIQSYAQLESVYNKNVAEIIKDNLNVHIFIGSNNIDTLEAFSRECGKVTRMSPLSALNGDKESIDRYQLETIPLLPVSALAHIEEGECVVTEANTGYVMWSRMERCYKCEEFKPIPFESERFMQKVDPFDSKYTYKFGVNGR